MKRHRLGAQYLKNMNNSGKSVRKKIGNLIGKKWIKDVNKILPSSRYSSVCFTLAVLREGHLRTVIGADTKGTSDAKCWREDQFIPPLWKSLLQYLL